MRLLPPFALLLVALLALRVAAAEEIYQAPEAFVAEAFADTAPEASQLWITGPLRDQASDVLDHPPAALRTRYWRKDQRTAWILEEIGKEEPITVGLVIQDGKLESIKVLAYREIRGWEVRHDFFTRQFWQASLRDKNELDRSIDGIAGATLSVNAMRRLARLALLYHRHVTADGAP